MELVGADKAAWEKWVAIQENGNVICLNIDKKQRENLNCTLSYKPNRQIIPARYRSIDCEELAPNQTSTANTIVHTQAHKTTLTRGGSLLLG